MKGRVARGVGGGDRDAGVGGGSDGRAGGADDGRAGGAGDEEEAWNDSGGTTGEEPSGQIPPDSSGEAEQKRTDAEGEKGRC